MLKKEQHFLKLHSSQNSKLNHIPESWLFHLYCLSKIRNKYCREKIKTTPKSRFFLLTLSVFWKYATNSTILRFDSSRFNRQISPAFPMQSNISSSFVIFLSVENNPSFTINMLPLKIFWKYTGFLPDRIESLRLEELDRTSLWAIEFFVLAELELTFDAQD